MPSGIGWRVDLADAAGDVGDGVEARDKDAVLGRADAHIAQPRDEVGAAAPPLRGRCGGVSAKRRGVAVGGGGWVPGRTWR